MNTKQPKPQDSKTKADLRLHGGRTRISIRCKPEIKEALKSFCEANGLSICHVFEGLATGYLIGMKQKINWVSQSPTINLTLVRDVKRVRRYGKISSEPVVEEMVEDVGSFESCAFCDERPVVLVFYWVSTSMCRRVFYCKDHWEERKPRGGFQGYKML